MLIGKYRVANIFHTYYLGQVTLYQFKVLEQDEQAQAIWQYGEHVATRMTAKYKILLWVVNEFYAEIFYNYIDNKIERIRSFRNPELIENYLDQIDISDIYK